MRFFCLSNNFSVFKDFEKWRESVFYIDFSWRFSALTNQGSLGFRASHGGPITFTKVLVMFGASHGGQFRDLKNQELANENSAGSMHELLAH